MIDEQDFTDMDFMDFEERFYPSHPQLEVDIPDFKFNQLEDRDYSIEEIREMIISNIRQIYDPEISVNIYDLGLIYDINILEDFSVQIIMTLTSANCPSAQELPMAVHMAASVISKVIETKVDIVWDPPWGPDKMSEEAKLELGLF